MATIYKADGTVIHSVTPENGTNFQLSELHAIVEGYIEIIPAKEPGMILVCNEESKMLDLPRNEKATQLAYLFTPASLTHDMLAARDAGIETMMVDPELLDEPDYISGDALYCKDSEVR